MNMLNLSIGMPTRGRARGIYVGGGMSCWLPTCLGCSVMMNGVLLKYLKKHHNEENPKWMRIELSEYSKSVAKWYCVELWALMEVKAENRGVKGMEEIPKELSDMIAFGTIEENLAIPPFNTEVQEYATEMWTQMTAEIATNRFQTKIRIYPGNRSRAEDFRKGIEPAMEIATDNPWSLRELKKQIIRPDHLEQPSKNNYEVITGIRNTFF